LVEPEADGEAAALGDELVPARLVAEGDAVGDGAAVDLAFDSAVWIALST